MKKITFNQGAAGLVILICIIALYNMRLHPVTGEDTAKDAIKALLALASFFLWGSTSGSQSKDLAIANSTPITDTPQSTAPAPAIENNANT